jgi:hypothetical protein
MADFLEHGKNLTRVNPEPSVQAFNPEKPKG